MLCYFDQCIFARYIYHRSNQCVYKFIDKSVKLVHTLMNLENMPKNGTSYIMGI